MEGAKELKRGNDCQADIGVLLEPCLVNLSTRHPTVVYLASLTKHDGKYENYECSMEEEIGE